MKLTTPELEKFSAASINDLFQIFDSPIRFSAINQEWAEFSKSLIGKGFVTISEIHLFTDRTIDLILDAVNLPMLSDIVQNLTMIMFGEEFEIPKMSVDRDNVAFSDANKLLFEVYNKIQSVQLNREGINHYITLIKKAQSHLVSLRMVLKQFILYVECSSLIHLSERERFFDLISIDLDVSVNLLKDHKANLAQLYDEISSRYNLLLRSDSALRLLAKFTEQEAGANRVGSRPNTEPMKGGDSDGFDITTVGGHQ